MLHPQCKGVGKVTTEYCFNQILIGKSNSCLFAIVGSTQLKVFSKHNSECHLCTNLQYWKPKLIPDNCSSQNYQSRLLYRYTTTRSARRSIMLKWNQPVTGLFLQHFDHCYQLTSRDQEIWTVKRKDCQVGEEPEKF